MIYLAGKVTGEPFDEVEVKFRHWAMILAAQHKCFVFDPVKYVVQNSFQDRSWQFIMKKCINKMMACDEIHLMPDWRDSKGAVIEHDLAQDIGMKVVYMK